MTNPLLKAFTLVAMVSESANLLSVRIRNARQSANELAEDMIARYNKIWKKIIDSKDANSNHERFLFK